MSDIDTDNNAVELATELTIAWLGNPNTRISAEEVPAFLGKMHETVSALLGSGTQPQQSQVAEEYTPAVSARKSSPPETTSMPEPRRANVFSTD